MRIIIYNSSSFGGCFDYGKALFRAYGQNTDVHSVEWWIPKNAEVKEQKGIRKLFIRDRPFFSGKWGRQIHFIYRILFNPIRLLLRLRAQPGSWVIMNDFEQLTALIWAPLFRQFLKGKHQFAIILHDPDRDAYPPSLRYSQFSMGQIMQTMDVAIYHDSLPQKPYYQQNTACRYIDLPHGFYEIPEPDVDLEAFLKINKPKEGLRWVILGNIREEKNYHLAIEALMHFPNHQLLIAGSSSNTRVNLDNYKQLIRKFGLETRVLWIEKFLSEPEMAAIIDQSDIILLNYAPSFTSQSGILNLAAPYKKQLIVSNGPSSLASTVNKFELGEIVEPQSLESLIVGIKKIEKSDQKRVINWNNYLDYASWSKHVELAIAQFAQFDIP